MRLHLKSAYAAAVGAIALWLVASVQFPETMRQVRLVMLLLAIGGPDG
jgi:hypothetical protein